MHVVLEIGSIRQILLADLHGCVLLEKVKIKSVSKPMPLNITQADLEFGHGIQYENEVSECQMRSRANFRVLANTFPVILNSKRSTCVDTSHSFVTYKRFQSSYKCRTHFPMRIN